MVEALLPQPYGLGSMMVRSLITVYLSLLRNIHNRRFRLNVIHDVGASTVKFYIDGALKYQGVDHGPDTHYFKFGVYTQNDPSNYLESRWKGIEV